MLVIILATVLILTACGNGYDAAATPPGPEIGVNDEGTFQEAAKDYKNNQLSRMLYNEKFTALIRY